MSWIIITCIASLITGAFLVYGLFVVDTGTDSTGDPIDRDASAKRVGAFGAVVLVFLIWLGITGLMTLRTVGEREVGVVKNFTGTIAGKREKGWVTIAPWQSMSKENVGILREEWDFGPQNSAVSKDQQQVFAHLAVNYRLDAANVLDLYREVGPSWKQIIVEDRIPQVFKEVTSEFQTVQITEQRGLLQDRTVERLAQELKPYELEVVDVFITNLGFSDKYTQSIEEKQKQVQDALRAEAKVRESEAIAKQKIAEAEGEAASNIARARGEATANRLRQRTLTPLLIQQQAIEKLNPNVQIIVCPPKTVCIPNSGVTPQP